MKALCDAKTKAVAANIRKLREFRNYTQEYLAAKLDISQNAYSKIELGYSNITINRLVGISEVLEIDLVDLINFNYDNLTQLKVAKA
ncbi:MULTISPECIES: helix-turn-helix transcriptional regulator [unclassified Mucilaginibacter]|uniref:helix-turn-helix domain-containing protein n=1 Tax=unclassified Mucilaginibacter TaxID=2617802 RepID=UPI0031F62E71